MSFLQNHCDDLLRIFLNAHADQIVFKCTTTVSIISRSIDLTPLTSGHFLIGGPLLAPGAITFWQVHQRNVDGHWLVRPFWHRWSAEWCLHLHPRPKWHQQRTTLQIDHLVVIKDNGSPVFLWKMGRIINLHPEENGLVLIASLKTIPGIANLHLRYAETWGRPKTIMVIPAWLFRGRHVQALFIFSIHRSSFSEHRIHPDSTCNLYYEALLCMFLVRKVSGLIKGVEKQGRWTEWRRVFFFTNHEGFKLTN